MCTYNAIKRNTYVEELMKLQEELKDERDILSDIELALSEVNNLINLEAEALEYIKECDFGGDKIASSITRSQKGYKDAVEYYDRYIGKSQKAILEIEEEMEAITELVRNLPENCGYCSECSPPTITIPKKEGNIYG
jgi:DNA repair exonuclease SbcCD ATPase subunit